MKVWVAALLAVFGVACVVVGVALIHPPSALIVFGSLSVAVSLLVEVRSE